MQLDFLAVNDNAKSIKQSQWELNCYSKWNFKIGPLQLHGAAFCKLWFDNEFQKTQSCDQVPKWTLSSNPQKQLGPNKPWLVFTCCLRYEYQQEVKTGSGLFAERCQLPYFLPRQNQFLWGKHNINAESQFPQKIRRLFPLSNQGVPTIGLLLQPQRKEHLSQHINIEDPNSSTYCCRSECQCAVISLSRHRGVIQYAATQTTE